MELQKMIDEVNKMNLQEVEKLVDIGIARLKYMRSQENLKTAEKYKKGDAVYFEAKGRTVKITIDQIKKGKFYGREASGCNWRVDASVCTKG